MNRCDRYPMPERYWNLLRLACVFAIVVNFSGCVSVPAGRDIVSRKWGEFETVTSRPVEQFYLSGDIVKDEVVVLLLRISAIHDQLESEETVVTNHKRLVLGLLPGLYANWYGGYKASDGKALASGGSYVEDVFVIGLAAPIANAILVGLPTVIPWFSEAGEEWQPPATRKNKVVEASLIGYAKTSKNRSTTGNVKPAPGRTRLEVTPVAGSVLRVSLQGVVSEWKETTNREGAVSIPLSRLLAQGATAIHVHAADMRLTKKIALPPQ